MRVAIIGAGTSGLACACELENQGIEPVIYEQRSNIYASPPHISCLLNIFHKADIKTSTEYFHIFDSMNIKPLNSIQKLIYYSPHDTTVMEGDLGYFYGFTDDDDSVKFQLSSKLKNTKILFSEFGDYVKLSKEFDYVLIATGSHSFADELGCWNEWFMSCVRGAIILGDFDPSTLVMWTGKEFCKSGYAIMAPFDKYRASISLVVPNANEKEIDYYWDLFLSASGIKYTLVEEFKFTYRSGNTYPLKVNNIFFAGNSAGCIEPFFGFGQVNAMVTGIAAARAISQGLDYESQIHEIITRNLWIKHLRNTYHKQYEDDIASIISNVGFPKAKQLSKP
ncbi:MAG: NAD(P)-binding protein [Clostridia bacterium]|nr:NAD(P)-binding protein [Clostridia bacterium]